MDKWEVIDGRFGQSVYASCRCGDITIRLKNGIIGSAHSVEINF